MEAVSRNVLDWPGTRGDAVSATVLYMSMTVDGFIAGPNEGARQRTRRRRDVRAGRRLGRRPPRRRADLHPQPTRPGDGARAVAARDLRGRRAHRDGRGQAG